MEELKKYYNSISRQSGIVHKDKAMRQLDLDLVYTHNVITYQSMIEIPH